MDDPDFAVKFGRIYDAWQTATGRARPTDDSRSVYARWMFLLVPSIAAQVACLGFAAALSAGHSASERESLVGMALILLAAEIGVPVYRNHRRRIRAREDMARFGGPINWSGG